MNVLSIDVGIKNLAFVHLVVDCTKEEPIEIKKWDVVNLLQEDGLGKKECMGVNKKNKSKCKSKACFYKNELYYCKKHARSSSTFNVPTQNTTFKNLKNKKILDLKEFCESYNIDISDCKYKESYLNIIKSFIETNFFNRIVEENANNADLVTLGKNINVIFNNLFHDITFDVVCIENQISPIANRMKTLQGMISQYFIMKGCEKIEFISSANKLKDYIDNKKTKYSERKKMGIDITRKLLSSNMKYESQLKHFNNHKKKDDLADCYLQGLYYVKHELLTD